MVEVTITLREITEDNTESVLALRCTPDQERFVTSVPDSLAEAAEYPHANPWFRAVYADDQPVGFVMLSWDVEPQPPEINGPWFLWKLLIDHRYQGRGYGREVVRQIVELVRARGCHRAAHQPRAGRRWSGRLLRPTRFRPDRENSTRRERSSCAWS